MVGLSPVVIGGDFNAWAIEWGSRLTNARGWALLEARLNVDVANVGDKKTYSRNGAESIIDVTFWSPGARTGGSTMDTRIVTIWRFDTEWNTEEDGHSRRSSTVIGDG